MSTINQLYDRVKQLDTNRVAVEALDETKDERIELNQQQLYSGKRPDGSRIATADGKLYAPFTIAQKIKKGQPYDRITLKDTGSFYAGITSDINGADIVNKSTDPKNDALVNKYGNVFGLGGPFKQQYIQQDLRPVFNTKIENAIGLKI